MSVPVPKRSYTTATLADFARQVEKHLQKGEDGPFAMQRLVCRLMTSKDLKVSAMMTAKWVEWMFGKAKETVQITGTIEHEHHTITERLTDDELAQVENLVESAHARGNQG